MSAETNSRPNPHWRIWKAADALAPGGSSTLLSRSGKTSSGGTPADYSAVAGRVSRILDSWGHRFGRSRPEKDGCDDAPNLQSLLNKSSLLHEAEESVVAIYELMSWLAVHKPGHNERFTVLDLCCGKGIFSMLLSYYLTEHTKRQTECIDLDCDPVRSSGRIGRIVMADRASTKKIDWSHIDLANRDVADFQRTQRTSSGGKDSKIHFPNLPASIPIEIWSDCNIHDPTFPKRLRDLAESFGPVIIVGIHLCKTLSPRAVGLFNILGPHCAPFLCLAPCCLPRFRTGRKDHNDNDDNGGKNSTAHICVEIYESESDRMKREEEEQLRKQALGRNQMQTCYLCKGSHRVRDCPGLPLDDKARIQLLKKAAASAPCWKCGKYGHQKSNCPSKQESAKPTLRAPPSVRIDISNILAENDDAINPFSKYCNLLAGTVQTLSSTTDSNVSIRDAPFEAGRGHDDSDQGAKGGKMNWNGSRKGLFIVAHR